MPPSPADRWTVVLPRDAVVVDIGGGRRRQRATAAMVAGLDTGCSVVLRGSRGAVRRVARDAGVGITRQLIPLPTRAAPAYLVEDDQASLSRLCADLLSVPPGLVRSAAPAGALLRLAARAAPFRSVRMLLPGRIAIGRRV
jgi:hypothetical protein